jgi:3-oxo-4,17-pregnadiene-20-carboxyl-CoA hydratase beta subunit
MTAPPRPAVGDTLPELRLEVTTTFVVSTAIATRDFQDVHHDRDAAVARGSKDIFLNILTTTGLVQRCVTDWAGPRAQVRGVRVRLGVPCYAGDTLVLGGRVVAVGTSSGNGSANGSGDGSGNGAGDDVVVEVVGRCGLGDHVTGQVRLGWA